MGENHYPDKIKNIIYNKEKMEKFLLNKKRDIEKQIKQKKIIANKLSTKSFTNYAKEEILNNQKYAFTIIIESSLKEEIEPYISEVKELE